MYSPTKGIGRLGGNIGLCLEEHGAKCIGVKEIDAYVYFPAGIKMSVSQKTPRMHLH